MYVHNPVLCLLSFLHHPLYPTLYLEDFLFTCLLPQYLYGSNQSVIRCVAENQPRTVSRESTNRKHYFEASGPLTSGTQNGDNEVSNLYRPRTVENISVYFSPIISVWKEETDTKVTYTYLLQLNENHNSLGCEQSFIYNMQYVSVLDSLLLRTHTTCTCKHTQSQNVTVHMKRYQELISEYRLQRHSR